MVLPITRRWQEVVAQRSAVLLLLGMAALPMHEGDVTICDAVQRHVPQPPAWHPTHQSMPTPLSPL